MRLLLFLALPVAAAWAIEQAMPFSILKTSVLFFPFDAHTLDASVPGPARITIFGMAPWMYLFNGAIIVMVAAMTAYLGRRSSFLANVGLYLAIAAAAALVVHAALHISGFPLHLDPL